MSRLEQRNQKMVCAVKNTRQILQSCIRSGSKDETVDKRKVHLCLRQLFMFLLFSYEVLHSTFFFHSLPPSPSFISLTLPSRCETFICLHYDTVVACENSGLHRSKCALYKFAIEPPGRLHLSACAILAFETP